MSAPQTAALPVGFAVRDTGIGLSGEGPRTACSNRSARPTARTTRKYGGTGLGLAISKPAGRADGRRMWAESAARAGARPSTSPSVVPAAAAEPARSRRGFIGEQPALAGRRVLVVDDNATNRRMLALQTGRWGMVVRDTATPRAGAGAGCAAARPSTWPSWTCTCRDGRAGAGAAPSAPRATRCRWCCSARSGRRDGDGAESLFAAFRLPLRQSPAVRCAGLAAGADAARPAPARRRSRRSMPAWPNATRCASCWPRTTW